MSEYKEGITIHLVPHDVEEEALRYAKERARRLGARAGLGACSDCEDVVPASELTVYPTFEFAPALCVLCYERRTKMDLFERERLRIELRIVSERERVSASRPPRPWRRAKR